MTPEELTTLATDLSFTARLIEDEYPNSSADLLAAADYLRQCAEADAVEVGQPVTDATIDLISKALRRAFSLGQTYWQQADSDSRAQHRRADTTQATFYQLVDETCAVLAKIEGETK